MRLAVGAIALTLRAPCIAVTVLTAITTFVAVALATATLAATITAATAAIITLRMIVSAS